MALYGYARVPSSDQDFALQEQALRAAGCDVVRAETASGTSRAGRTELETLLDFLQRDDTLVVTRIDRLARSGVGYQEYQCVYGEDAESALRFLFNAMAAKADPAFPFGRRLCNLSGADMLPSSLIQLEQRKAVGAGRNSAKLADAVTGRQAP